LPGKLLFLPTELLTLPEILLTSLEILLTSLEILLILLIGLTDLTILKNVIIKIINTDGYDDSSNTILHDVWKM